VKRNSLAKSLKLVSFPLLAILILSTLFSSCSWIQSRRSLFGDEDGEKKARPKSTMKMVPKVQYDQLMSKYENLLRGNQEESAKNSAALNRMEENGSSNLVSELNNLPAASELAETVDVFGGKGVANRKTPTTNSLIIAESSEAPESLINSQIIVLQKANRLLLSKKYDAAMARIKRIENSPVRQIRVRAKFMVGEILFQQEEYDLAMQVFEDIISKDAFSGIILKALGRLIVCSEKLKIKKKQETYYSILHDFFEST
jgi:TolA-binding protein